MEKKYFDEEEARKIFKYFDTNYNQCIKLFEQYFEKYPLDYATYPYYASMLVKVGRFEEAEKILNYAETKMHNDTKIMQLDKVEKALANYAFTRIKIYSYTGRYKECLKLCIKEFNLLRRHDINVISTINFCKCKLKRDMSKAIEENNSYSFNQMIEYSEEAFLDHIKKHLYDYNIDVEEPNNLIFSRDFPLEKVITEIKNYIPSEKRILEGMIDNTYMFRYEGCGTDDNKKVNFFKVVTLDQSQNFITMFPMEYSEKNPYIDLDYVRINQYSISNGSDRIKKFNKKYNIN